MWHTEVSKSRQCADGRGYQIIGDKEECSDNGNDFTAVTHTRVNAAAVRIQSTDDDVVDPDQCGQQAHQGDEPKRGVAGNGKGESDDVGFAGAPIPVKDRGSALPIDVTRPLNVGRYHLLTF